MRASDKLTTMMALCLCGAMGCALFEKTSPEELAELVPPSREFGASAEDLQPAVRLTAELSARMQLDLATDPEGALEAVVGELASSTFTTRLFASEQLTYLVPQLARSGYQLDLAATRSELTDFELSPAGILSLGYTAHLVVLAPPGSQAPSEPFLAILPGNPWRLQERAGHRCLEEGHRDAPADRYAYYFEPGREGCEAAMVSVDVSRDEQPLTFNLESQGEPMWPEYDLLAADGRVEAVVVAGAISPNWEPGQADPTKRDLSALIEKLIAVGFVQLPGVEDGHIVSLEREILIDKETEATFVHAVTIIGPEALARGEEREDELQSLLERAEVLLLSSEDAADAVLSVLSNPEVEPGYQIFAIDGSWRYADQAVEIFAARSSLEDPSGGADVDVLTNISPAAVVGRDVRLQTLLLNLFRGAEVGGIDGDRYFSWDRIVATANLRAREATGQASHSHGLLGFSGLEGNRFVPSAP